MVDQVSTTTATTAQFATQSKSAMDKDAFLKLMIAQLKNQDPLEPMDSTDYSAQLAQFSSLEQLQNINDNLNTSIDANYLLTQSINNTMTATLIGKDVKIATNTIKYNGQESTAIGYELPVQASEVKIKIYDSTGNLVKTFDDVEKDKGEFKVSWDFTDDDGKKLRTGDYTVKIEAQGMDKEPMEVAQYIVGKIGGVRFTGSGTALIINGIEYPISDVFEILESDSLAESNTNEDNGEGA